MPETAERRAILGIFSKILPIGRHICPEYRHFGRFKAYMRFSVPSTPFKADFALKCVICGILRRHLL